MGGLYEKHILHSLSIAAIFNFPSGTEVIDIGTGGGFPGIPLAIFFPEARFHLVDSIGKKIKVVEVVAGALGLKNVTTRHGRAEEITDRKFNIAVSRAVAPLGELWKWSKPLLHKQIKKAGDPFEEPNGLICLKGGDLSLEIAESGTRPRMVEIREVFDREYFREKYMLFVER
jgi:16S rRNA (guanine527-N7)-methyltransferase